MITKYYKNNYNRYLKSKNLIKLLQQKKNLMHDFLNNF